jgi:hypothetical protein
MVSQPLPAHRAEVAQKVPGFTTNSRAVSEERQAGDREGKEYGQSDETKHGSNLRKR